jgi:hypothetical protein
MSRAAIDKRVVTFFRATGPAAPGQIAGFRESLLGVAKHAGMAIR